MSFDTYERTESFEKLGGLLLKRHFERQGSGHEFSISDGAIYFEPGIDPGETYLAGRVWPDLFLAHIAPGACGPFTIVTNPPGQSLETWVDGFVYQSFREARRALLNWERAKMPEPDGWTRSVRDGRRRTDGDPATEYIRF